MARWRGTKSARWLMRECESCGILEVSYRCIAKGCFLPAILQSARLGEEWSKEERMIGMRQTFRNSAIVLGVALLVAGTALAVLRGPQEGVLQSIWGGLVLLAMGGITEYLWMRLDKTEGR